MGRKRFLSFFFLSFFSWYMSFSVPSSSFCWYFRKNIMPHKDLIYDIRFQKVNKQRLEQIYRWKHCIISNLNISVEIWHYTKCCLKKSLGLCSPHRPKAIAGPTYWNLFEEDLLGENRNTYCILRKNHNKARH